MTKFAKPIMALTAAVCALGSVSILADDGDSMVAPEDAFTPVERYAITYDKPRDVAEFYLGRYGLKLRDADLHEMRHPTDRSMKIMFITVDGIEDDAVSGVQWRLGLKFKEGSWQATEAGMRRKCARGDNAGNWTKDVCP